MRMRGSAPIMCQHTTQLHLLPFEPDNALLPGETMKVGLNEAAHERLLCEVMYKQEAPYFGMLLRLQEDDADSGWASQCAPYCMITDKEMDADGMVWLNVKCIGRRRIVEFDELEMRFDSAYVENFVDADADADKDDESEDGLASAHADKVHSLFEECRAREAKLDAKHERQKQRLRRQQQGKKRQGAGASTVSLLSSPLRWSRDSCPGSTTTLGEHSLGALTQHRISTMLERGPDEPPSASLEGLHEGWGVSSDAELEAQLASFAAHTYGTRRERLHALQCTSTRKRLEYASQALERKLQRLKAEMALYDAVGKAK